MALTKNLPPAARSILDAAEVDRAAARAAVAKLDVDAQLALVCESPVAHRAALLDLLPEPAEVIVRMPPAELCFVAKSVGLADAGWLLEHASPEQLTACADLDVWKGARPDLARIGSWLEAFADAGEETQLRAAHALDMELLVLELRERIGVVMKTNDDDWEPPAGAHTLDGQFWLVPLKADDDLAAWLTMLRVLFQRDYWFYFRMVQAAVWELESGMQEWALRWRSGRLQDLGFPEPDDARRVYARLRPDEQDALPVAGPEVVGEWPLAVWMPSLPSTGDDEPLIFRALAELPESERRAGMLAFLALANRVAMADGLQLSEHESLPLALEKAARLASLGLAHLAEIHGIGIVEVLRAARAERLFRLGFQLSGEPIPEAGEEPDDPDSDADPVSLSEDT
jgi:hypothetical protein